jgi:hypothetical protein
MGSSRQLPKTSRNQSKSLSLFRSQFWLRLTLSRTLLSVGQASTFG